MAIKRASHCQQSTLAWQHCVLRCVVAVWCTSLVSFADVWITFEKHFWVWDTISFVAYRCFVIAVVVAFIVSIIVIATHSAGDDCRFICPHTHNQHFASAFCRLLSVKQLRVNIFFSLSRVFTLPSMVFWMLSCVCSDEKWRAKKKNQTSNKQCRHTLSNSYSYNVHSPKSISLTQSVT